MWCYQTYGWNVPLYVLALVGLTKHVQSLNSFHPVEYVTRAVFASSTTTLVASTSGFPAKTKTKTTIKEIPKNDGDSIAMRKPEKTSKQTWSDRWTSGCGELGAGVLGSEVEKHCCRESTAYMQLRAWLR